MKTSPKKAELRHLERLAWLLDSSIRIPWLGYRIGLDGLIGLVPGFGDFIGAAISSYIVAEAARHGAPASLLARMGLNVALDTVIGTVPILGDLFDFAWKANQRNVRLLQDYSEQPRRSRRRNRIVIGVVLALFLALIGFAAWIMYQVIRLLWTSIAV